MDLAAAFYLSVYGLAALSGGILAWAEQEPSVTALTPIVAAAALLLNERFRILRIDGLWIGAVGLIAFIYPTYEFLNGKEEVRLLAGAHLLAILQWVLMFYNKLAHQYWWICALSCLQIALAALLTTSPLFGVFILIYMFLALWTLSVFTLLLARLRYDQGGESPELATGWEWPKLRADEVVSGGLSQKRGAALTSGDFQNAFQGNANEADLNWRFVFGVCGLSSAALLLGLIFFLLTPRLWMGAGNPFQDSNLLGGSPVTGFSEKVQLRDFGRILESSAPVLELSLFDDRTNKPYPLHEYLAQLGQTEPLLRGSILANYHEGEWFPHAGGQPNRFAQNAPSFLNSPRKRYIRQTIRLEANASRTIFSLIDPEYGRVDDQAGELRVFPDTRTLTIFTQSTGIRGAIVYHLMAPERTGDPSPPRYQIIPEGKYVPHLNRTPIDGMGNRPRGMGMGRRPTYLGVPDKLEFTRMLANQLEQRARAQYAPAEPTPTQIANTIIAYLRDSGTYQYSLDQSRIDSKLDPIEDFLKNRKTGHCQYFATSLALLLRVMNIPARVVTGYKGGVESPTTGNLEVQQRHAHAWVEAKLDDVWVTLDATPSVARDESVAAVGDRVRWYHTIISMATGLWSDYVVNLSFSKQQRDLYAPVTSFFRQVTTQVAGLAQMPILRRFWLNPAEWFSVAGGVTAFFLMLGMVGVFYLVRYLWRLLMSHFSATEDHARRKAYIEFYERFLAILKPLGMVPKPYQTQLEFAQQVEADWTTRQLPAELGSLAKDISTAFYRLRFGAEALPAGQEQAIKSRLQKLESELSEKP